MMPVTYPLELESTPETPIESADTSTLLARDAIQALGAHTHFHGRTDSIRIDCRHDTLIVAGRVPSFYLKQLLQETLRHVDGVGRIDNRVDVICPDGLSSAPRH